MTKLNMLLHPGEGRSGKFQLKPEQKCLQAFDCKISFADIASILMESEQTENNLISIMETES